jgi:hypothetical protein
MAKRTCRGCRRWCGLRPGGTSPCAYIYRAAPWVSLYPSIAATDYLALHVSEREEAAPPPAQFRVHRRRVHEFGPVCLAVRQGLNRVLPAVDWWPELSEFVAGAWASAVAVPPSSTELCWAPSMVRNPQLHMICFQLHASSTN